MAAILNQRWQPLKIRNLISQAYFKIFQLIAGGGELITIENPSLSALGYQLLPLATSQLVGNNREFDVSGIFGGVLLIVRGGELITIEGLSLSALGYQLLPLATSQLAFYSRVWYKMGLLSCI